MELPDAHKKPGLARFARLHPQRLPHLVMLRRRHHGPQAAVRLQRVAHLAGLRGQSQGRAEQQRSGRLIGAGMPDCVSPSGWQHIQAQQLSSGTLIDSARFLRRAKKAGAMRSCTSRREVAEQICRTVGEKGGVGRAKGEFVVRAHHIKSEDDRLNSMHVQRCRGSRTLTHSPPSTDLRHPPTHPPTWPTVQKMPNRVHSTAFSMSASSNTSSAGGREGWHTPVCS